MAMVVAMTVVVLTAGVILVEEISKLALRVLGNFFFLFDRDRGWRNPGVLRLGLGLNIVERNLARVTG